MNETLTRPRGHMNGNDLRRHVLALVLFFVLVWYTVVSPSYTAAPLRAQDARLLACDPARTHAVPDAALPESVGREAEGHDERAE